MILLTGCSFFFLRYAIFIFSSHHIDSSSQCSGFVLSLLFDLSVAGQRRDSGDALRLGCCPPVELHRLLAFFFGCLVDVTQPPKLLFSLTLAPKVKSSDKVQIPD